MDYLQSLTDLWHRLADSPTTQSHALLAGILVALSTLVVRRRKPDRTRISVDAPPGQSIRIDTSRPEDDKDN